MQRTKRIPKSARSGRSQASWSDEQRIHRTAGAKAAAKPRLPPQSIVSRRTGPEILRRSGSWSPGQETGFGKFWRLPSSNSNVGVLAEWFVEQNFVACSHEAPSRILGLTPAYVMDAS